MEVQVRLVGQVRDVRRVAAGIVCVGRVRIQRRKDRLLQHVVRRGQRALHLVVDDAVDGQVAGIVKLPVPALLLEDLAVAVDVRMKDRVQVDVHQVLEVLQVAARDRVHRLVRVRHRVEERVQGAFRELDEGILDRKLLRPAQHRVLDDVRHAGRVLGRRAKSDIEHLIVVVVREHGDARAGLPVAQEERLGVHVRQEALLEEFVFVCGFC